MDAIAAENGTQADSGPENRPATIAQTPRRKGSLAAFWWPVGRGGRWFRCLKAFRSRSMKPDQGNWSRRTLTEITLLPRRWPWHWKSSKDDCWSIANDAWIWSVRTPRDGCERRSCSRVWHMVDLGDGTACHVPTDLACAVRLLHANLTALPAARQFFHLAAGGRYRARFAKRFLATGFPGLWFRTLFVPRHQSSHPHSGPRADWRGSSVCQSRTPARIRSLPH